MNKFEKYSITFSCLFAGMFLLTFSRSALSETNDRDKAQVLLQDVKTRELERQQASKATEVERLNEDLNKQRKESEDLEKSIEPTAAAINEATERLAQLSSKKQRLLQTLELVTLQIAAEKLKLDGLKMLNDAQNKASAALSKRIEETEVRAAIQAGELKLISDPEPVAEPDPKAKENLSTLKTEVTELRKKLAKGERATFTARVTAREAMQAASEKLQLAEVADRKAKARSAELGLPADAADDKQIDAPRAVRAQ